MTNTLRTVTVPPLLSDARRPPEAPLARMADIARTRTGSRRRDDVTLAAAEFSSAIALLGSDGRGRVSTRFAHSLAYGALAVLAQAAVVVPFLGPDGWDRDELYFLRRRSGLPSATSTWITIA